MDSPASHPTPPIAPAGSGSSSRRRFLQAAGLSAVGLALGACSSDGDGSAATSSTTSAATGSSTSTTATGTSGSSTTGVPAATTLTAADFAALGTCSLLPEKTAGPFPLDQQFDRRDVTEDHPGHPLRLGLRVVDGSCQAVPGATVEIWHADATGDYSAFADGGGGKDEAQGTTFLRGSQTAGDDGIVEFLTIYPGWYRGRAVHIHLRVHVDGQIVRTSQLFFDEDYTAKVYADAPYAENGLPDTSNAADSIAGDPSAEGTLLHTAAATTSKGAGTLGLLNLGLDSGGASAA